MKTGSSGTFVISWSQTEVDGVSGAALNLLAVGTSWRWSGAAVRVDAPQAVMLLEGAEGLAELRKRAARMVRRLIGAGVGKSSAFPGQDIDIECDLPEQGFIVTDGRHSYTLTLIAVPDTGTRLLMVLGDLPPNDRDLWVVRTAINLTHRGAGAQMAGGVICFTPDTRLATETGPMLIQNLRPGDRVLTRDNGPQEVLWSGQRRMTGARLHAMPHLRPIRIKSGALGVDRPDEDLLVSPQHRMLVRGPSAQALFNTSEVLVMAGDLVNDGSIMVDHSLREVTYVHILLEQHNVIWANGLESESFHPSNTALETVDPMQREDLIRLLPDVERNPQTYGDYARRNLSSSEAAILRYDMGPLRAV